MPQTLAGLTRLLVVQELQEDASGATVRFHDGAHGRLAVSEPGYAAHLRLARRSHERQQPVGVHFGEGSAITAFMRADSDVPTELADETPDRLRVLFQGHDGVFQLKHDQPGFDRIHSLLGDAVRRKTPVWFVVQKSDLGLLDVREAAPADDGRNGV